MFKEIVHEIMLHFISLFYGEIKIKSMRELVRENGKEVTFLPFFQSILFLFFSIETFIVSHSRVVKAP